MKAVAIQAFGGPEGLRVVSRAIPTPGPREVLVATEAIGVGGVDVLIRSGALAAYGFEQGHVLGSEVAGTITAVGDGVAASWIGQRVLASLGERGGGYAEYAVADVASVVAVPAALSSAHAVGLGNASVAKYSLARAAVREGDRLLVRGASGSIGLMITQLAAAAGITVAATTSSRERGERLRRYGVAEVLDRAGRADGATVAPFDAIIDIVAGPEMTSFFAMLGPGGRMVLVGVMGGPPSPDFAMAMIASFQKSMIFSTLSLNIYEREERRASMQALLELGARGALQPVVHDVLALEDAATAHEALASGAVFGKLVLAPARGFDVPRA